MKKIMFVLAVCVSVLKGYSQCNDCHQGGNYSNNHSRLTPDSSGGLAKSYILQNVCGLNWSQSSVLVETRSVAARFNTNGTGLPATIPITFDSCSVDSVIKAFLYFNGSYQTSYAANPASVSITNPVALVYNYLVDSIGTGPAKCWGEHGTIAYRADVTNCIHGGGNYVIDPTGTGITSWAIDGMTLLIIYKDKSATYSGSIVLYDGLWTGNNSKSQTFSGFNVCNATPTGQAFSILADMQSNINGGHNTETYNGSTSTFNNLFYNFCTVTTSLTAGQTSAAYSVYTNDAGGDCYSWVISGLYWQNTNCTTCHPSILPTLTLHIVPPEDTICSSDSVQLTASGATTYVWGPATGLSCTNCPNPKASPNATTTYTVTGFNGCSFGVDTVQIVVGSSSTPTVTPTNPRICSPDSVQLNVVGGANFIWRPASSLSCSHCSNPWATPTVTTTYTVVEGVGGCKDSTTVTVTVTSSPTVSVAPKSPTICAGSSVTLTASGASNYNWTPAASLSCPSCSNPIATPTATTVYTVTGSIGLCGSTVTDTVFVVPAPTAVVAASKDSVCAGDSLTLEGGTGLTYKWSPSGSTVSKIHVTPATTTTYTFYSYSGLCVDSTIITIPVIPLIAATARTSVDSVCPGGSATLTATATGGPATYLWSPGGGTSSSVTVVPDSTTTYTVTVTGKCNSKQILVKVTLVPLPVPMICGTNWKCRGVRDTLTYCGTNGPATYVWSNGKTTTSIYTGLIDADSTVSVTAYNKLGCSATTTFSITLRTPLTITFPTPPIFCAGQNVCISGNVAGTPLNPVSYAWSDGETTSTICVAPDSALDYSLTVSNGCKSSKSILVTPNYPNLAACCSQTLSIINDTVTPSQVVMVAGGNSTKYAWAPSVNCLNPICDSVMASPTPSVTTIYTVTGTDANGCQISQLITITVDVPCFNLIVPNVFTPTNGGTLGLDKVFYIDTRNIAAWSITIFDRWGKTVFTTSDQYKYWDGTTTSGGPAPAGVYYYVITGTCQNTTYKRDGFLQLIR